MTEGPWEVIKSHKRKDRYEVTITHTHDGRYDVDMWTPTDLSHWSKSFKTKDDAIKEFERWLD